MTQYLVETDILADFLTNPGETILRKALKSGTCYTTMYNALELFHAARTDEERDAVKKMLMAVRVLGFNFRYAEQFSEFARSIEERTGQRLSQRETFILGMTYVSKLTVLTQEYHDRYASLGAVVIVKNAQEVPA